MKININELKDYILHNSTFAKEETIDIVLHDLMQVLISNNFDLNNLQVVSGETSINFSLGISYNENFSDELPQLTTKYFSSILPSSTYIIAKYYLKIYK